MSLVIATTEVDTMGISRFVRNKAMDILNALNEALEKLIDN